MKFLILLACLLTVAAGFPEHLFSKIRPDPQAAGEHWGVLVAGSNTWGNYRHQADICHAYQILHKNGIADDHIIVFMYDDIAYNELNPIQGSIINKPGGVNVYPGTLKNYTGRDVTPENFIAVLEGNEAGITIQEKNSTGGVLKSGPNDNVFIYFADHGAPDLIAFPSSELYEKDLMAALHKMFHARSYDKLVFFLEACESGSMFEKLPTNMHIYATTAAGPDESSWGTYCDDPTIDTCLGDEYSVRWMEDADVEDLNTETLAMEFAKVKSEVKMSTPHEYGDFSFKTDTMDMYVGQTKTSSDFLTWADIVTPGSRASSSIASPEMKMALLQKRLMKTSDSPSDRDQILQEIVTEAESQRAMIRTVATITTLAAGDTFHASRYLTRPQALAVRDEDCYRTAVSQFSRECYTLGQHEYALRLVFVFANLCNDGISAESIGAAISEAC